MKKALNIAWKDLLLVFRDPTSLLLMLVAPLALTLVVSFAFGGLGGGSSSGFSAVPVALVNLDQGQFSGFLVDSFQSKELTDLVTAEEVSDEAAARKGVDQGKYAAAVIIPSNFSESVMPSAWQTATSDSASLPDRQKSQVEIYSDPARSFGVGVVKAITDTIVERLVAGSIAGEVTVEQLLANRLIASQDAATVGRLAAQQAAYTAVNTQLVAITRQTANAPAQSSSFNWLVYSAPGMAVLYLMFTMTNAARSILSEKESGTLLRLMATPTQRASVLGGKMLGTFCTGLAQMLVLLAADGLIFGIHWGNLTAVLLVTIATVAAATGWGLVEAAFSRTPGQANALGMAINLVFGILGGSFMPRSSFPAFLRAVGNITPNAWGTEAYYNLIHGQTLAQSLPTLLVLGGMAVVLFGLATVIFNRRYAL